MSPPSTPDDEIDDRARVHEEERRARLSALLLRRTALTASEVRLFRDVFPEIVEAHSDRIWDLLRRKGVQREALPDLLQEVFVTFFGQVVNEGFPDSIASKLHAIAAGKVVNLRRGEKREPVSLGLPSSRSEKPKSAPEAERALDLRELAQRLLFALSEEHRAVVEAILLRELSHEEAAAELGIARTTVTSRLMAARQKLAEMAKQFLPESQRGAS